MNVLEIVTFARRLLSDQRSRVFSDDGSVVEHMNAAYEKVMGEFMTWDEGYGLMEPAYTVAAQPLATGKKTAEYALPPFLESIKQVALIGSTGQVKGYLAGSDMNLVDSPDMIPRSTGLLYYLRNRKLVIDHSWAHTGLSGSSFRVEYYRAPARLMVAQVASATSSTVVLPASPYNEQGTIYSTDDYYNGCQFEVVSGTGEGQIFTCGDYAGSTRTLSLESGETFAVTLDSTSIIAMIPNLPDRAHSVIAYMTARDGARIEENISAGNDFQQEINERMNSIRTAFARRQLQTPRTAHIL